MLKNMLTQLVVLSLFLSIASAASIHIISPEDITFSEVVKGSSAHGEPNYLKNEHLGSIAPGQTLALTIDRSSGTAFFWDNLDLKIPDGWQKTGAKHASDFHYDIIVPKDAKFGTYVLSIHMSGDIQVLTPAAINLSINVREDVYSFKADSSYPVYIDASNLVPFSIKSDSLATDRVHLSIEGIPANWVEGKDVVLSPNEERRTFFLVEPKTEGSYPIKFKASSSLGGAGGSANSQMIVYPASLKSKLEVLNEGFSIVTVILQPLYSLLSLIGSLL